MSTPIDNLKQDLINMAEDKAKAAVRMKTITSSMNFTIFLKRCLESSAYTVEELLSVVDTSDCARFTRMWNIVMHDHRFQDVRTLRSRCRERGIQYYATMTRDQMVAALEREDCI